MAPVNLRIILLPIVLALLLTPATHAASSDKATMELQYRFPICSEVLKAKQNASDETEIATDRLEGAELSKILNQLKRQGADLNAYYRLGTPLHHAACAGWNVEANWLLRNGADPFIQIENDSTMDALGIAVKTENWEVASTLLKHFQRLLKAPGFSEKQQEQIYASVQRAAPQQDADESVIRFEKLLRNVGWKPSPKEWGRKFGQLLCNGQVKAALEVLKAQPWANAVPREISDATWTCPINSADKIRDGVWPKEVDMPTWRALDALLPSPVLLPLITVLPKDHGKEALQAAIASGLRAPWLGKDNAATYFQSVLSRRNPPPGATPALLRLIPNEYLLSAMDASPSSNMFQFPYSRPPLGGVALLQACDWPLADLEWLLKHLSPRIIEKTQTELYQWSGRGSVGHWERLTPHLIAPLTVVNGYPKTLPYALWPKWKALGAVPDKEKNLSQLKFWDYWLAEVPLAELPQGLPVARAIKEASPQTWPSEAEWAGLLLRAKPEELADFVAFAKSQRPDLLARFLDWALAPLSYGPTPDPVALQIDRSSQYSIETHWQRVRQLAALGFKSRHPRYLAHDLLAAEAPVPTLDEAIRNGWAIAAPSVANTSDISHSVSVQWSKPQLTCHKRVDDSLRRSLAEDQWWANDPEHTVWEYVLPIQVTGLTDCQWIFVGGNFPGKRSWTDHDFFEGEVEQQTGAADGNRAASFWHADQKKWFDSGVVPDSGDFLLLHQSGQPAPWVAISGSFLSVPRAGNIFQARLQPNSTVALEPLPEDHPARVSLITQCGSDLMLDECEALKVATQDGGGNSIVQFVDTYWPQAKQDFLVALLANDRAALNRMREQGLFAHWLSAGLRALGEASSLSLMDKRRRAAWVLASSQPSADFDEATLASLVPWLPPEDWRPIVKRLRCYPRKVLLEQAEGKSNFSLSTRLQNEMNRFPCEGG